MLLQLRTRARTANLNPMSQNAIHDGCPYHLVDVEGHEIELELVEGGRGQAIRVDVMAPGLIIDPTDDQWAAARRPT
jgi:hypothetical protein